MIEMREDQQEDLLDKVIGAIDQAKTGLSDLHRKYEDWRRASEGRPRFEAKTYPHAKASNIAIPLTMDQHQTMYGALLSALLDRKPLILVKPLKRDDEAAKKQADTLTEFIDLLIEDDNELGFQTFVDQWLNSSALHGIGFDRETWEKEEKRVIGRVRVGEELQDAEYTVSLHEGVRIHFVAQEDRLWDQAFQDLNKSPVVADRFRVGEEELREREAAGEYQDIEAVLDWMAPVETENEQEARDRVETERGPTPVAELWEAHVLFDVNEDGFYEDVVCVVHAETRSLLASDYNSFGERMLGSVDYKKRVGWLQGMGVGAATEHLQEAMNTLWNMRIDGIKIAETPVWLLRKGSGLPETMDIWAGMTLSVNNVDDIKPLVNQFGFQNTRAEEQNLLFWSQRANGASDSLAGFPDGVMRSSDTVGGQVLRLKQSNAMFRTILRNYEAALSRIFQRVFKLLVMHAGEVLEREAKIGRLSEEKQAILKEALDMEVGEIPLKLRFLVNTTDVDETYEMQRQSVQMVSTITKVYAEGAVQLTMLLDNPQVGPMTRALASNLLEMSTKMLKETLKLFSMEEAEGSLPDTKKLEALRRLNDTLLGLALTQQAQSLAGMGGMNGQTGQPMAQLGGPGGGGPGAGAAGQGAAPQGGLPGSA